MSSSIHHENSSGPDGSSASGSRKRACDDGPAAAFDHVSRAVQAVETTFITIHDLTRDANILYCSQSITDVLDWSPEDVIGRPCWDFFHPDELSFAKDIHGRGVHLDKASVLNYCRIKNRFGDWIGCECVFTVVYNVLIGCTSVYLDGPRSKKRAIEAPVVRQLFSSSPRDPRYHMLSYISAKFRAGPRPHMHEPRAALFLNRFTRTLTISFATSGLETLLGIPAEQMQGKSFYYCIQENCLAEAIRCLESAKANDSIAYLRFWYRDPRLDGFEQHDGILNSSHESDNSEDKEDSLADGSLDGDGDSDGEFDDEDGGVQLAPDIVVDSDAPIYDEKLDGTISRSSDDRTPSKPNLTPESSGFSRQSSSNTGDGPSDGSGHVFDRSSSHRSSTPGTTMSLDSPPSSMMPNASTAPRRDGRYSSASPHDLLSQGPQLGRISGAPIELEAVISCTSDGLVVILRGARPFVPESVRVPSQPPVPQYSNGLFASPWAKTPIMPTFSEAPSFTSAPSRPGFTHESDSTDEPPASDGDIALETPPLGDPAQGGRPVWQRSASSHVGLQMVDFMNSIREVAVFAWALTGINGSLQRHGRGRPLLGAVPYTGLPVWQPDGTAPAEGNRGPLEQQAPAATETKNIDGLDGHSGDVHGPLDEGRPQGPPDALPDGMPHG